MKNQFVLFTILLLLTKISFSQQPCISDSCIYGPFQRYTEVICGDSVLDPNGNGVDLIFVPYIIAVHNYQIVNCGGTLSVLNLAPIIIDDRPNLIGILGILPNPGSCAATLNNPLTPAELNNFLQQSSTRLLGLLGLPDETYIEVRRKGTCMASVKLEFPEGDYDLPTSSEGGTVLSFHHYAFCPVYQFIECAPNCCVSRYVSIDSSNANGEWHGWGYRRWQFIGTSVEGPNCDNVPVPDYSTYRDKFTLTESNTGREVYPKHIATSKCFNTCSGEGPPVDFMLKSDEYQLEVGLAKNIELSPVPFNTYLKINTKTVVKQYHILDNGGNILVKSEPNATNFNINTSALKPGIYYIQFYLNNGQVVSYKIVK